MGNNRLATYAADEVSLSFCGIPINSGYADGEFVAIEVAADDFGDVAGADGETARTKNLDRRATITIKLLQTSLSNNVLQPLTAMLGINVTGADVTPLAIKCKSQGVKLVG